MINPQEEIERIVRNEYENLPDTPLTQMSLPAPPTRMSFGGESVTKTQRSFPFQIMIGYSDNSSTATVSVYVRHGAFILNDTDGTHRFVSTDTLDEEADYSIFATPDAFADNKTLWAKLDKSTSPPTASIVSTEPADDPDTYSVCIGKVATGGFVEQYVFGHIPAFGGAQLDHSFLPTQTSDTTFSITKGRVYVGMEATATLPTTASGLAIGTDYFIKVDWTSSFRAPVISWTTTGGTNTDLIRYYPIIEFTGSTWDTLIRRQTSDLNLPNYPIPEIPSTTPAVLVWNGTELEWVSASYDYSVFQRKADDSLGFDYVRAMP